MCNLIMFLLKSPCHADFRGQRCRAPRPDRGAMPAIVWESLPWLPHCTLICEQHLALCCLDTCSSTELRALEVTRESSLVMCPVGSFSLLFVWLNKGKVGHTVTRTEDESCGLCCLLFLSTLNNSVSISGKCSPASSTTRRRKQKKEKNKNRGLLACYLLA